VEADEEDASASTGAGWGNEDDDLFADQGFEPMEPSTPSPMPSYATMKPTPAPMRPSTNANSSMSLGGAKSARLGFGSMDDGGAGKFRKGFIYKYVQ